MRILHLATSKSGGAGIAAERLHDALLENGYESIFITLEWKDSRGDLPALFSKLRRKISTFVNRTNTKSGYILTTAFSHSSFQVVDLENFDADIVHIHNWYNFLSIETIARIANNHPTVITMHDERLYTGACHYTLECNGYLDECKQCPAVHKFQNKITLNKIELPDLLSNHSNLYVVAPSKWLADRLNSTYLGSKVREIIVIPNIIPAPETGEIDLKKSVLKQKADILFVAVDPDLPTKGLDMLVDALSELAREFPEKEFRLNIVGKSIQLQSQVQNLSIIFHGFLSHSELVRIYTDVDLVVVPSRTDNSPSVVSEAQLCGAVVLGTRVGGIPELIQDSMTGFLSTPNVDDLKLSILRALKAENRDEVARSGLAQARRRHAHDSVVEEHAKIYKKLMINE